MSGNQARHERRAAERRAARGEAPAAEPLPDLDTRLARLPRQPMRRRAR